MSKKICVIGAFDFVNLPTGGQPVKTRQLYVSLVQRYGADNVDFIETYGWKRNPIKLIKALFVEAKKCDTLIMLPAHNGVEVFSRLLLCLKKTMGINIFYDVIGGWLADKTQNSSSLRKILSMFDGIWVETSSMCNALKRQGFANVWVVPNFKNVIPLKETELPKEFIEPFRLVTFSRVTEKKGISIAINAVSKINKEKSSIKYTLDIYGDIDEEYQLEFQKLLENSKEYVHYAGIVSPENSVEVLKDYFALLFPTQFFTEGVPGTLIDAYCAGVPVITSLWLNYSDVFAEGLTGYGYSFEDIDGLYTILNKILENVDDFLAMKTTTLKYADNFNADKIVDRIVELLQNGDKQI
jgi:glycosyltransferase involved in cell wall biosynthesis